LRTSTASRWLATFCCVEDLPVRVAQPAVLPWTWQTFDGVSQGDRIGLGY